MIGPLDVNPFENLHFTPLMPRAKADGSTRVIVDLSWAIGPSGCTLATNVITYLMWRQRHWVVNYLDDIIGVSQARDARATFCPLRNLLQALGLPINFKKVEGPPSEITCLGININARTGVLTIPQEKNYKIKGLLHIWSCKTSASCHEV